MIKQIALLVGGAFLFIASLHSGFKFFNPVTYQDMDKAGTEINCEEMLADSLRDEGFDGSSDVLSMVFIMPKVFDNKLYVYDREIQTGYRFKQCRYEIEKDHKNRCDRHVASIYVERTPMLDGNFFITDQNCKEVEEEYLSTVNDEFVIEGNALLVGGHIFGRHSFSMTEIEPITLKTITMYRIGITNGEHSLTLEFSNKELADDAQSKLYAFISKAAN